MVLICNIKDVEIAKDRAKKLINEVRALQIPELAGSGITISVGGAYSRIMVLPLWNLPSRRYSAVSGEMGRKKMDLVCMKRRTDGKNLSDIY